jgi:hypothetical protein
MKPHDPIIEKVIEEAAGDLQKPAGPSEKFANLESIIQNHKEFVERCHDTWKRWHKAAVGWIFTYDAWLQRDKTHPLPLGRWFGEYNCAVWRRVNDAIVWSFFGGRRDRVKRLCLYRPRTFLSESNPDSVLPYIEQLNENPLSFALWNDATSCVDIGDVTYIENGMRPVPSFVELKQGKVNDAIIRVLDAEPTAYDAMLAKFTNQYGEKGAIQLERVIRQKKIGEQALTLFMDDKGIDPVSGEEISVTEGQIAPETYDERFDGLLSTAITERKFVVEAIDGCLWVCVNGDEALRPHQALEKFSDLLAERLPRFKARQGKRFSKYDKDRIVRLHHGFNVPVAKPLFLRRIAPASIASIVFGTLMDNVFLYLDWDQFGRLFEEAGGTFSWASDRERGRVQAMKSRMRPALIGGRLPRIGLGNGAVAYITDPNLVEIFFDGITPKNMTQRTVIEMKDFIEQSTDAGRTS